MEPHILTQAREHLSESGEVLSRGENPPWYYLAATPEDIVEDRYRELVAVHRALSGKGVPQRIGQCLEIAVYRVLFELDSEYLGSFEDLDLSSGKRRKKPYSKLEPPPRIGNRRIGGKRRLDFMVRHEEAGWAGIEVKNVREWLYPGRDEIRDLMSKCAALDCVPVLIARRYPYVTFKVLKTCGVVVHQTYNQRLHIADEKIAARAKDKRSLGYHDIRLGDAPDDRLRRFLGVNLPKVLPAARERFDDFKDLLEDFGNGEMGYDEFAARVRRREAGVDEDADWEEDEADF